MWHAILSKAYGEDAMKKSSILSGTKQFKEGRENVEDDERHGCPRFQSSDEKAEKVQNLLHSDRRLGIITMAVQLYLDKETVEKA
jgi:hypothetical protein